MDDLAKDKNLQTNIKQNINEAQSPPGELKANKTKSIKGILFYLPAVIVCAAQVGTSGDNSVVGMAMGQFIKVLHANMDEIQITNIIYSLVAGALMVFGGMLGIAKGFRGVFLAGSLLAFLGEVVSILSPNIFILCYVGRLATGFGAALMVPSILGIIVSLYTGKARAIAFGGVGAATGVAAVAMPVVAGYLMDNYGFRVAFGMMAVWFLLVFIIGLKAIPPIKPSAIKMDYKGTILMAVALFLFIIGCSKISVWGIIKPLDVPFSVFGYSPALFLIIIGIILAAFTMKLEAKIESKEGAALIPQSFIRTPQVRDGLYVTGLIFAVFGAVFFVNVSWIMLVAGQNGVMTGIAMATMAFPMIILSIAVPRFGFGISPHKIVFAGIISCVLGAIFSSYSLNIDGFDTLWMFVGLALFGVGAGCLSAESAMVVSTALSEQDAAQSGGIQCSTRNIWQAAAVAIIGSVMLYSLSSLYKSDVAKSPASAQLKSFVASQSVIGFMSNDNLIALLDSAKIEEKSQRDLALYAYEQSRLKAARYAFFALIIVILLHIPGMSEVPRIGWSEKRSKNEIKK